MLLFISGVQGLDILAQENPSSLVIISAGLSRTELTYDNSTKPPASDLGFSANIMFQPSLNPVLNVRLGFKYSLLRFNNDIEETFIHQDVINFFQIQAIITSFRFRLCLC